VFAVKVQVIDEFQFHSIKETSMLRRIVPVFIVMMFALVQVGQAQDKIQKYFNDTASKVKATEDPAQKREILNKSFETMTEVLDRVQVSPLISKDDQAGIARLKATLQDNQDELAGLNGYEPVPDAQLNDFADYSLQAMEQADQQVTISLVAALLIIIIIILIA
jgi:hypothetical protein